MLSASRGGGRSLPEALRTPLEGALGADLSAVRLHEGPAAGDLNRSMSALAFTHGRDIFFRDGLPDTSSDAGMHLLAHELTHTVQQGFAPVRRHGDGQHAHGSSGARLLCEDTATRAGDFVGAVGVRRSTEGPRVMRHAAFEHYLLGQLQPYELQSIPQVRKIAKNKDQKKRISKSKKKELGSGLVEGDASPQERLNVKHILEQEMKRLLKFKDDPDALAGEIGKKGKVERSTTEAKLENESGDLVKTTLPSWNVPVVVLTCAGGETLVVSYSEMNTMPDLFGNPEAIAKTPKKQVLALLQGVRQQLYIELSKLREELFGEADNQLHSRVLDGDFEGAQGPRSQEVNAKAYEVRTEKQVNKATSRKGEESEQYFAALERNACHFAPESWHQWRGYHERAIESARMSYINTQVAESGKLDKAHSDQLRLQAAEQANQALLLNSFGEHYLQDSFAAGHLIDKTKIMQWFALWLEKNGKGLGTGATAVNQWKMAVYAAAQDLTSNPQALHDKMVRGKLKDGAAAQAEIGMQSQPEIEFLVRWRALAKGKSSLRSLSTKDAEAQLGTDRAQAALHFSKLATHGFASKDRFGGKYTIKSGQVDAVSVNPSKLSAPQSHPYEAQKGKGSPTGQLTDAEALEAVAEFNINAYNILLSNAYIGSSTKFFHDRFCQQGLEVVSTEGASLGRIYGDSNMLNAGGQLGVLYAAETSRMSRSSVFSILDGEGVQEKYTTAEIESRFPTTVIFEGAKLPIVDFNTRLHELGEKKLFKEAQTFGALVVYKAMGGISDKGALDPDKLVKGIEKQVGPLDLGAF